MFSKAISRLLCLITLGSTCCVFAHPPVLDVINSKSPNQTDGVSPVLVNKFKPFQVEIEVDFMFPDHVEGEITTPGGIHSFASASYDGKWLFICGRTNGMHSFNNNTKNFPPAAQNRTVYVVDPSTKEVFSRSLDDDSSGLNAKQIASLSVTSPQDYQMGKMLYVVGGYGKNGNNPEFSTKNTLSAIDIPGMMKWVMGTAKHKASHYIRQITHPAFQVTGGYISPPNGKNPALLIFGQNFTGFYFDPSTNGVYSEQVRPFYLKDNGSYLSVKVLPAKPLYPGPNYRRRDLNIMPAIVSEKGKLKDKVIAYAGVFTENNGVWTVPVEIDLKGKAKMADPSLEETFKQAMNQYTCSNQGLFSEKNKEMYSVLFGGISYGLIADGKFITSPGLPFMNQVTTIKIDEEGNYSQYLMNNEFPVIKSKFSNPGNTLYFGAGSQFMLAKGMPLYDNGVINFDKLKSGSTVIGYIVGGIQSTVRNTQAKSDSAASPYVFKVTLTK